MNDEELRAFLDSATVGESDEAPQPEVDAPPTAVAEPIEPEAQQTPRRGVPSFEELMNMPAAPGATSAANPARAADSVPAAEPTPAKAASRNPFAPRRASEAVATPPQSVPQQATQGVPAAPAAAPAVPAAPAEPQAPVAPAVSQAPTASPEELVPLILPGFSPEPRQRQDLPPVFRTEPAQVAKPAEAAVQHPDELAPTQPFDVLTDQAAAASAPAATAPAVPAAAAPAAAAPSAPAAPAFPFAAGPRAAATTPTETVAPVTDNPFALLSEDLVTSDAAVEYDDEYEPIAVTGGESRGRKALPWIIVGGGAIIALVASIFVINGVRANENTDPVTPPTTTTEPAPTPEPSTKPEKPEETKPVEPTTAPVIDPGSTWDLRINQWDMTVEVSEKLGGSTPYTLTDGNSRAMFDSLPVTSGISDACAAAKAEGAWGLQKNDDGKLEVVRPEPRCADPADAAVYDTIWGALDYMAKSAKAA